MQSGSHALLIVDDDVLLTRSLSRSFSGLGWHVDVANGGREALEVLSLRAFDAMIVDLQMPGTNGLGVMEQLQPGGARPLTILLSGHLDVPTTMRAVRLGVYDVVEKPALPSELDEILRLGLERREHTEPGAGTGTEALELRSMYHAAVDAGEPWRVLEPLREIERRVIEGTWLSSNRNLSAAARKLGIPRSTLRDRLRKFGLL